MQPKGKIISLKVMNIGDLRRDIVKSEHCKIKIPELGFELPTKKSLVTTIEGFIEKSIADLSEGQPIRKHTEKEVYEKIETFLGKLGKLAKGEGFPFTF